MNILIREAKPGDCEEISRVIKNSMGYDNPPELIRKNLERILSFDRDKVLVAELNEEIIGIIHREDYDCLYYPHVKDLMTFAVKEEYQRKYVGTKLLAEIERWAKETGRIGIRVLSSSTRVSAHSFYISRGYSNDKTQLNFKKIF